MKVVGFFFAGLFLLIGIAAAGPVLNLSESLFDFGYVPQNSKVSHVFWLHNSGDQDLKITKVTPGCGCTQAPLDKQTVPPGDSARLEFIFSTRLYYNHVNKPTVLECEGLSEPTSVGIAGFVIPRPDSARPLMLDPFKLDISQYGEEVLDRATFSITNISDKDLALMVVAGAEAFGTLTLPKTIGPKETVEATLVLKPEALASELIRSFTFQVNDEARTRYTVPVRRRLKDPRVGELVAPGE